MRNSNKKKTKQVGNPREDEINSTPALVRGVAAHFTQLGCEVKGFDAYCESTVLPGSGLSSSAAYEVLMGTIINHLFFDAKLSPAEVARIGQYAENVFFGKPCGLMDQTASAVGNLVTIDFFDKEHPVIQPVAFDFSACGHALCIIDTGANHADLTEEYAAIPGEIKAVCAHFGKDGKTYGPRSAFCLETQHYPDCIHHPEWPSCILRAEEPFHSFTTYTFSV